jgi:hypothetical protein
MRVKRTLFFTLLAVLTVVTAQSALALLSSGTVEYHENGLNGYIEYAVYESRDEYETAWSVLGLSAPGDGQYVYAYKIINLFEDLITGDVAHFALFGLTEDNTSGLGCADDEDPDGVEPSSYYLDGDESKGVWKWAAGEGNPGYIQTGEHSWLLVFSSNQGPVKGDFEIKGPEGIDVPDVPEPSMIALLGAGGALFLRRRKQAKQE